MLVADLGPDQLSASALSSSSRLRALRLKRAPVSSHWLSLLSLEPFVF
jgi:hypothetical protein